MALLAISLTTFTSCKEEVVEEPKVELEEAPTLAAPGEGKVTIAIRVPAANTCNGARGCLLYTSPSPRDGLLSRMPSSA